MSACEEKSSYPSFSRAQHVAARRQRDNHTLVLRPYMCPDCGKWHLTSQADKWASRRQREMEVAA